MDLRKLAAGIMSLELGVIFVSSALAHGSEGASLRLAPTGLASAVLIGCETLPLALARRSRLRSPCASYLGVF